MSDTERPEPCAWQDCGTTKDELGNCAVCRSSFEEFEARYPFYPRTLRDETDVHSDV